MTGLDRSDRQRLKPVLLAIQGADGLGGEVASYLQERQVRLGFSRQRHSGARWFDWRTLRRGVFLNAEYRSGRLAVPHLAALVVHEVVHLRQGICEALSVRGELVAWQAQRAVLDRMVGPGHDPGWQEIQHLDPSSRGDLRRAREIMRDVGGPGYHIELLPLLSIGEEIKHIVGRLLQSIRRRTGSRPNRVTVVPEEDDSR